MVGKPDARQLEDLARDAARSTEDLSPPEREKGLVVIAETCFAAGLETAGRSYLEQAAKNAVTGKPLLVLGDHYASKKLWDEAAERYGRAWEKERKEALPLFLQGWAMVQNGAVKEGKRRMDLAHWVPLGDEAQRESFGEELKKRGHAEAARREFELLLRTSKPGSFPTGEALRQLGIAAMTARQYADAAEYHQRSTLRVMRPFVRFSDMSAYVTVPHFLHRVRARALAEAGQLDEARKEADICLELEPANADLAVLLVGKLEKSDRKKDADELFEKTRGFLAKLIEDHPESAWGHNGLAWLCAGCRRQLDTALQHSRKAVKLTPDSAGYLDTLAETYFQRGEKEKAIELMKKCVALDGKKAYFRKQLKRFEAGDRAAELPPEDED
jgi:tetratricopeptide (TPR) repeat protein